MQVGLQIRRVSLCLVSCLLPLAAAAGAPSQTGESSRTLPGLIRHVKRAVVVVNSYDGRGHHLSQGSGFFVAANLIVTNLHVVGLASRVEITTYDGQSCAIEGVVAYDRQRDLTLLRTCAPIPLATTLAVEPSTPRAGEEIFVVSNPRGSAWRVSRGTMLAHRDFQDVGELVRITASISEGSSGGPVVNRRGRVVGVATMNLRAAEEMHFAVPGDRIALLRRGPLMPFPLLASQ